MAVRPIDGNELYRIEKLLDTDIVRQDKAALNLLEQVLYDIQHMPTLTPPNEPLALEQLREMDGEPVWVVLVDEKFSGLNGWYLVPHGSAYLARIDDWELDDDKYGVEWLAYRRPPEGEEDT